MGVSLRICISAIIVTCMSCLATSCGFDEDDEPELIIDPVEGEEGVSGEVTADVALSSSSLSFGHEGGSASISVVSNVPLYLESPVDSVFTDEIPAMESLGDFYNERQRELVYSAELADTCLAITVGPSESRNPLYASLQLYGADGRVVCSLSLSQGGNPDVTAELSDVGRSLVISGIKTLDEALSMTRSLENAYLAGDGSFRAPLSVYDSSVEKAYATCYRHLSQMAMIASQLHEGGLHGEASFFELLSAIVYAEVSDKWGCGAICGASYDFSDIRQYQADSLLIYQRNVMHDVAYYAAGGYYGYPSTAENMLGFTSDVASCVLADVHMLMGDYRGAAGYLRSVIDNGQYGLAYGEDYSSGNNMEVIMGLPAEDGGTPLAVYTLAGVILDYAECEALTGNIGMAFGELRNLCVVKNTLWASEGRPFSGGLQDALDCIDATRVELSLPRRMAFLRRNSFPMLEQWQYRWPLPASELLRLPSWIQNEGYRQ